MYCCNMFVAFRVVVLRYVSISLSLFCCVLCCCVRVRLCLCVRLLLCVVVFCVDYVWLFFCFVD